MARVSAVEHTALLMIFLNVCQRTISSSLKLKIFCNALNSSKEHCFINNKSSLPLADLTSMIPFQQTLKRVTQ